MDNKRAADDSVLDVVLDIETFVQNTALSGLLHHLCWTHELLMPNMDHADIVILMPQQFCMFVLGVSQVHVHSLDSCAYLRVVVDVLLLQQIRANVPV